MNDYSGAVYEAPASVLPHIVLLFKEGRAVACLPVESREDGERLIERALEWLPRFENFPDEELRANIAVLQTG